MLDLQFEPSVLLCLQRRKNRNHRYRYAARNLIARCEFPGRKRDGLRLEAGTAVKRNIRNITEIFSPSRLFLPRSHLLPNQDTRAGRAWSEA